MVGPRSCLYGAVADDPKAGSSPKRAPASKQNPPLFSRLARWARLHLACISHIVRSAELANSSWLKKYTRLEHLKGILQERQLYLGDPKDWEDRNDSEVIRLSSTTFGGFNLRATCLTEAVDRYHFWHIFGGREHGVCLWFEKYSLLNDVENDPSLIADLVQYRNARDLSRLEPKSIPFTKRDQYSDEREFRILRVERARNVVSEKFAFSAHSLRRIYLNPWLSFAAAKRKKAEISSWLGRDLEHVHVYQNRSLRQKSWIDAAAIAVGARH